MPDFANNPGLFYVVATLLPLASFVVLLIGGGLKNFGRAHRDTGWGESLYWLFGGDRPGKGAAYLATAAIGAACVLCVVGLFRFINEHPVMPAPSHAEQHAGQAPGEHAPAEHGSVPDHRSTAELAIRAHERGRVEHAKNAFHAGFRDGRRDDVIADRQRIGIC